MSTAVDESRPDAEPTSEQAAEGTGGFEPQPIGKSVWAYLFMPLFLAVVLALLYLYVSSQELDSIEQRLLNSEQIIRNTIEHLQLAATSTVLVVLIAVSLGVLVTRRFARPLTGPMLAVANIGQAVPTIGLIAFGVVLFIAIGFWPAVFALVAYAVLPVLRNTMVGLEQVDRSVLESGQGMGMTKRQVLTRIELPLAVPVILAGVRTALIINVGTATLATFINAGGLGDIINGGIVSSRTIVVVTGSILAASLALLVDYLAGIAEDILRPKGL